MPGKLLNLILVISAHRYLVRQGRESTSWCHAANQEHCDQMYECCCAGLFNNASGSQCRFWSGDGVGQSGFRFYCGKIRTIRRSRLTISIALFLSVWMQLRRNVNFAPGLSVLPVKNRPKSRLARWGIYASIINEVRRMRRVLFSCFLRATVEFQWMGS